MMKLATTLLILTASTLFWPASQAAPSMDDYTVCAVYHRMMAGALKRDPATSIMAGAEEEKMHRFMAEAKRLAVADYGDDLADEIWNDAWRTGLSEMQQLINYNYDNVTQLRYRYKNRCAKLQGMDNAEGG